jgi:hypothetical protein
LRSGDVWVERFNYRRFDSYLLPGGAAPASWS